MGFRPIAALAAVLVLAGCRNNTTEPEVDPPLVINECETNTAQVCGTWTLDGREYDAAWLQGARAVIAINRFTADSVVFTRQDTPASTSAGMKAVYRGRVQDHSVSNGLVTWTHEGLTFSGTWSATW